MAVWRVTDGGLEGIRGRLKIALWSVLFPLPLVVVPRTQAMGTGEDGGKGAGGCHPLCLLVPLAVSLPCTALPPKRAEVTF